MNEVNAISLTVCVIGGVTITLILLVALAIVIKEHIDHSRLVKSANESERQRKAEGKTADEWYGK